MFEALISGLIAGWGVAVPLVDSAVLTGRGALRFGPVTLPARYRFTHLTGRGYRHYIEATWFGLPVMKVNEWYLDGHGRMELPSGAVEGPKTAQCVSFVPSQTGSMDPLAYVLVNWPSRSSKYTG